MDRAELILDQHTYSETLCEYGGGVWPDASGDRGNRQPKPKDNIGISNTT